MIKHHDAMILCKQLAFTLDAGLSIHEAIDIIHGNTSNNWLKTNLPNVNLELLKGKALSEALANQKHFPLLMINMIKVGEQSGNLPSILTKLSDYFEREYKLNMKIKNAMMYPVIVSVMMISVLVFALMYVLPSYAQMFSDTELPFATKVLLSASDFLIHNYHWLIVLLIAISFSILIFKRTKRGEKFIGRFVITSPIRKLYLPRLNLMFAQTLNMLLNAGVNILSSIELIKDTIHNSFLNDEFDEMLMRLKKGDSLSQSTPNVFNSILRSMITIGENTGKLSELMEHCEEYFQTELESAIAKFEKYIEPVITIVMGLILAFVMLAIIEPTFRLSDIL